MIGSLQKVPGCSFLEKYHITNVLQYEIRVLEQFERW